MDLPTLSDTPLCHPNCCLSLSTPLLETIKSELYQTDVDNGGKPPVPPGLILSVGCGSGLLENLLHSHLTHDDPDRAEAISVEGAEVATAATTIMSYLPEDRANTVAGTWALCRRAEDATALLFVYPRSVDLVKRYVDAFFAWDKARTIIWLGPQADWDLFRPALEGHNEPSPEARLKVREGSGCGVGEYEMMAILQAPIPIS